MTSTTFSFVWFLKFIVVIDEKGKHELNQTGVRETTVLLVMMIRGRLDILNDSGVGILMKSSGFQVWKYYFIYILFMFMLIHAHTLSSTYCFPNSALMQLQYDKLMTATTQCNANTTNASQMFLACPQTSRYSSIHHFKQLLSSNALVVHHSHFI